MKEKTEWTVNEIVNLFGKPHLCIGFDCFCNNKFILKSSRDKEIEELKYEVDCVRAGNGKLIDSLREKEKQLSDLKEGIEKLKRESEDRCNKPDIIGLEFTRQTGIICGYNQVLKLLSQTKKEE